MNTRMCYGSMVSSRQTREFGTAGEGGPSPEMVLEAELIDLRESDEIVDLTCESLEPTVIDLTCHDSVVITEERRRRGGNTRSFQSQTGSSVVSSDKEELIRNRDVYVTDSTCHNALEEEAVSCTLPGYIRCRICMDGYSEIELSRRHIYSTECGHIFCSRCLCMSLKYNKNCPVCLKKSTAISTTAFLYEVCCVIQDRTLGMETCPRAENMDSCHPIHWTQKVCFKKLL